MSATSHLRNSISALAGSGDETAAELAAILEQYLEALESGRTPDRAAILAAHPHLADALEENFHKLDALHAAATGLAGADVSFVSLVGEVGGAPKEIGDFRILRELGRGGMGIVYEAEQLSLKRKVALKVLPFAALLDKRQLARFQNEARAAATLAHPNIVPVHAVGEDRSVHYYAVQLVRGQSLAEAIEQMRSSDCGLRNDEASSQSAIDTQPLAALATERSTNPRAYFRRVAELGIEIAQALDHAHEHGIIHRDVKPANILLDNEGKAYITDFGLARLEADASMTASGDLVGTLRYMSPEQARGDRTVDHRSDVYSLGVTLYELATLRPAFDGADRPEILRQICSDEPRSPSSVNRSIPRDLETIVLKAIAKDSSARYSTARELANDLLRFSEQRPITARRRSRLSKAAQWARRNRSTATIAAVALLLLATLATGGPIVAIHQTRSATELRRVVREKTLLAARNADLAAMQASLAEERRQKTYDARIRAAQAAFEHNEFRKCLAILEALKSRSRDESDLRDFEWHYLDERSREATRHPRIRGWSPFYSIAFSPTGHFLATGTWEGKVQVRDTSSQQIFWQSREGAYSGQFAEHLSAVQALEFFENGKLLLSVSRGRATIWRVSSGERIATLRPLSGEIADCDLAPNEEYLAVALQQPRNADDAGHEGARIEIYHVERQQADDAADIALNLLRSLEMETSPRCLSFSCDGSRLAASTIEGQVQLWDSQSWATPKTLPDLSSSSTHVAFSTQHPGLLAVATARHQGASHAGHVRLFDVEKGRLIRNLAGEYGSVRTFSFSRDGQYLSTGGNDNQVRVWDVASGRLVAAHPTHTNSITAIAFSPDGSVVASASSDATVQLCAWQETKLANEISTSAEWILEFDYSPDDQLVACAQNDSAVVLYDSQTTKQLWRTELSSPQIASVDFSPDGSRIVACGGTWPQYSSGELVVLSADDGRIIQTLRETETVIWSARFSPHGDRIVATIRPDVVVMDSATGKVIWRGDHQEARRLAWSSDGKWIVSVSSSRESRDATTIKVWDAQSGTCIETINTSRTNLSVAISPDSKFMAAPAPGGPNEYDVGLWDISSGELLRQFEGHTMDVWDIGFSPDGSRLVTGSWDATARIWNVHTGEELLSLRDAAGTVSAARFSSDGQSLVLARVATDGAPSARIRFHRIDSPSQLRDP